MVSLECTECPKSRREADRQISHGILRDAKIEKTMIGRDENNEEVSLRVVDRRKFNPDGSLKDGIVLEPEPKKPEPERVKPAATSPTSPTPEPSSDLAPEAEVDPYEGAYLDDEPGDEADEIPGAQDPASFVNFLSTLAT